MSTAIKITNITKKFGQKTALNNVSFETKAGEVFGLLGPNGAGKTTLIKLITGLLAIDEGEIQILGNSLEKNYVEAMKTLGAIVENPEMYKHMTGMQNIMQYVRMREGITKERINEVIELVGLTNRINEKVGKYSLGMRQRLGVALSLLHKPKVLILDEPTNGLDPAGIKQLRDIVTSLAHNEGICVIVSSHLMSEMELMCDRIAIIDNGSLIRIDTVENIINNSVGEEISYSLRVSDYNKAKDLITSLNSNYAITILEDDGMEIVIPNDNKDSIIAGINSTLVKNNVDVYSIIPINTKNLEDAFIEITNNGGNQIA